MAHPRWPGYNDKTGDPIQDNLARNGNRYIWKTTKRDFKILCAGRKRKKFLKRVEGGRYIALVVAVANQLAKESK